MRSGHQGSNPTTKFSNRATATMFQGKETFEYDEVTSKRISWDFWYRWPGQTFLRPPHYKSMGKKSSLLYLLWRKYGIISGLQFKKIALHPCKGHLRSQVTNRNLPITFDQKEIETWDWCQRSSWPCNMTHNWPWRLDEVKLTLRHFIYGSRALTRQTQLSNSLVYL